MTHRRVQVQRDRRPRPQPGERAGHRTGPGLLRQAVQLFLNALRVTHQDAEHAIVSRRNTADAVHAVTALSRSENIDCTVPSTRAFAPYAFCSAIMRDISASRLTPVSDVS